MHHRLKHIRKELKFTQKEMARELGVSLSTVQRFEKGNSSPDAIVLDRLSRLGVDLHHLITGVNFSGEVTVCHLK